MPPEQARVPATTSDRVVVPIANKVSDGGQHVGQILLGYFNYGQQPSALPVTLTLKGLNGLSRAALRVERISESRSTAAFADLVGQLTLRWSAAARARSYRLFHRARI